MYQGVRNVNFLGKYCVSTKWMISLNTYLSPVLMSYFYSKTFYNYSKIFVYEQLFDSYVTPKSVGGIP